VTIDLFRDKSTKEPVVIQDNIQFIAQSLLKVHATFRWQIPQDDLYCTIHTAHRDSFERLRDA